MWAWATAGPLSSSEGRGRQGCPEQSHGHRGQKGRAFRALLWAPGHPFGPGFSLKDTKVACFSAREAPVPTCCCLICIGSSFSPVPGLATRVPLIHLLSRGALGRWNVRRQCAFVWFPPEARLPVLLAVSEASRFHHRQDGAETRAPRGWLAEALDGRAA